VGAEQEHFGAVVASAKLAESIREASAAEHPVETVAVVIDSYQFADFAPAHHFVVQHCLQVKVLLHWKTIHPAAMEELLLALALAGLLAFPSCYSAGCLEMGEAAVEVLGKQESVRA